MVRTAIPGELEHLVASAGSANIAVAGNRRRGALRIIGLMWIYAGVLKHLQNFSPGRHPSTVDFKASALGAFNGGVAAATLAHRLRKCMYPNDV